MRHLLLRKQRTGKTDLDAGDCGHLAFTLTFTPDGAAAAAAAPPPQPPRASASSTPAAAAAAAAVTAAAVTVKAPAKRGADDAEEDEEEEALLPNKYQAPRDLSTTGRLVVRITGTP